MDGFIVGNTEGWLEGLSEGDCEGSFEATVGFAGMACEGENVRFRAGAGVAPPDAMSVVELVDRAEGFGVSRCLEGRCREGL